MIPARLETIFTRTGLVPCWLLTIAEYEALMNSGWIQIRTQDGHFALRHA